MSVATLPAGVSVATLLVGDGVGAVAKTEMAVTKWDEIQPMSREDRDDLIDRVLAPAQPGLTRSQIERCIDIMEAAESPEEAVFLAEKMEGEA